MASLLSRNRENRIVTFSQADATVPADTHILISPDHFIVEKIEAVWSTAGGANAAVKLKKTTGTTAVASGTELHSTAFDLTGAAATVNTATITAAAADRRLKPGDRLGLDFSGTLTNLVGLNVTVYLRPVSKYR